MKLRTLFTTALTMVMAFGVAAQMRAEGTPRQDFSAIYVGPAHSGSNPDGSSLPGFGVGTIGLYTPIDGTPCFSCFGLPTGAMAIGPAVSVATQGTGYTWYFTVQTNATTSGDIRVYMRMAQHQQTIGSPLVGTLSFNANSVYVVYSTLPVATPPNPGTAFLVVGLEQGGTATQAMFAPIVIQ